MKNTSRKIQKWPPAVSLAAFSQIKPQQKRQQKRNKTVSQFCLESAINAITREERLKDKITKSCIDHILSRTKNFTLLPAIISKKLADHIYVRVKLLGERVSVNNKNPVKYIEIADNKAFDQKVRQFNRNNLVSTYHLEMYVVIVEKQQTFYETSKKQLKVKQRKQENKWIDDDILACVHLKNNHGKS